jgi:hypothetical protein
VRQWSRAVCGVTAGSGSRACDKARNRDRDRRGCCKCVSGAGPCVPWLAQRVLAPDEATLHTRALLLQGAVSLSGLLCPVS